MAERWVPLMNSLIHSSIWRQPDPVRIVWITLLCMADKDGYVGASLGGIADEARLSEEQTKKALNYLMEPDKDSRDPEANGRRVWQADRGFLIPHIIKFRERIKGDSNEQAAERMRKHRELLKIQEDEKIGKVTENVAQQLRKLRTKRETETKRESNTIIPPTPLEFMAFWNEHKNLPPIRSMVADRSVKLTTRCTEAEFVQNWKEIIDKLARSTWHTGHNDHKWKATVDWILKNETNYLKILERAESNNHPQTAGPSKPQEREQCHCGRGPIQSEGTPLCTACVQQAMADSEARIAARKAKMEAAAQPDPNDEPLKEEMPDA